MVQIIALFILKIVDHSIYKETKTKSIGDDSVGGMQCPPTILLEAYVVGHNISVGAKIM